ncbi:MAG: hypothetical protein K8S21_06130 [Gemmatimonadetes bacterium]|nr:hypothetical protein [Gemmatimonadota bacterium]
MNRFPRLALAALLALSPVVAHAQAHPLAGKWTIEYTGGMRIENGEPTAISAKALLTITEVGDSLVATLHMEPNPNLPPRPDGRFAALKAAGNEVTFKQRSEAKLNMNGEEHTTTAISTWILKVTDDVMTGTLGRELEGMQMELPPPQPVTGRRAP